MRSQVSLESLALIAVGIVVAAIVFAVIKGGISRTIPQDVNARTQNIVNEVGG